LEKLLRDAALIESLFVQATADEGHSERLLQLPWAVHELVHGVLQHMCAPYAHIQVLHHDRVDPLKQSLQATSLSNNTLFGKQHHCQACCGCTTISKTDAAVWMLALQYQT